MFGGGEKVIRIAVCDDEESSLHVIAEMLKKYHTVPVTASFFQSGEALLEAVENFDIILLDIDMQGINGLETAKRIRSRDKKVKLFYITSYSDYTIFAFEVHAFAYLLKPLDETEFFSQLDEAVDYGIEKQEHALEFHAKEGIMRLKPSEIIFFEYANREVILHSIRGIGHLKMRMGDVADKMKLYDFAMPHKSFLVNLYAVTGIHGYDILLTDKTIIPLSQKKSAEFRRQLNAYFAGRKGAGL